MGLELEGEWFRLLAKVWRGSFWGHENVLKLIIGWWLHNSEYIVKAIELYI